MSRSKSICFSAILSLLIAFPCIAQQLSSTPPSMPPEENPPVIDSLTVLGSTVFNDTQLLDALTQHLGDKITIIAVQSDLRALAALYCEDASEMTEGWSGFALVTPKVTVTPEIAHPSDGHVTVQYTIKETGI